MTDPARSVAPERTGSVGWVGYLSPPVNSAHALTLNARVPPSQSLVDLRHGAEIAGQARPGGGSGMGI